jgi:regulator of cell morphogenesis and NO signaling
MIRPDLTVTELVQRRPDALAVLAAAGIDTCCGGAETLERAAADAGLAWDQLLARLEATPQGTPQATPAPAQQCGCGCRHG